VAYHAGLFNIGGEGAGDARRPRRRPCANKLTRPPGFLLIRWASWARGVGALWAAIPGYLQARRGSHIVITTIMFNWLASVLIVYLLVNVLREPQFHESGNAHLPGRVATSRQCTTSCAVRSPGSAHRQIITHLRASPWRRLFVWLTDLSLAA
jgi:ABC-type uncharacterized transport system permease subunit